MIVGSVSGGKIWSQQYTYQLKLAEWSPDMKNIIFITRENKVLLHDSSGNYLTPVPVSAVNENEGVNIIGIHWYNGDRGVIDRLAPTLAIAFQNGKAQIMKSEKDPFPVLIDTGLELTVCKWNQNGTILTLGGTDIHDPKVNLLLKVENK